jgi:hypothetical protein
MFEVHVGSWGGYLKEGMGGQDFALPLSTEKSNIEPGRARADPLHSRRHHWDFCTSLKICEGFKFALSIIPPLRSPSLLKSGADSS